MNTNQENIFIHKISTANNYNQVEQYTIEYLKMIGFIYGKISKPIPLVSVIVCVYNGQETLAKCLESIINQTYTNLEIIIINDGSTDKTSEIINHYSKKYSNIRCFYQKNRGLNAARNFGIKESSGKYLKFFDADDILFPYSIEILVSELLIKPEAKLIFADYIHGYEKTSDFIYRKMLPLPKTVNDLYRNQLFINTIIIGTTLIEREAVIDTGSFNEHYKAATDFEFFNRFIIKFQVTQVHIPTHIYSIHSNQITGSTERLRIFTDLSCLELLENVKIDGIFPETNDNATMASKIDYQARCILRRADTPFASIIKLLETAEKLSPLANRQSFISDIYKMNNNKVLHSYIKKIIKNPVTIDEGNDILEKVSSIYRKSYERDLFYKMYLKSNNAQQSYHYEFWRTPDFCLNFKVNNADYIIIGLCWDFFPLPVRLKKALEKVAEIWVTSNYLKKSLIESNISSDKIYVIHEGTDIELFTPESNNITLDGGKFKFLFIGDFSESSGIYTLLEAYMEEFSVDDNVSLTLKYDYLYQPENQQEICRFIDKYEKLAKPEIIFYNNYLSETEITGLYHSCDCFVYPYQNKSMGKNFLRAMSCAKPLIITSMGIAADYCNSENSFLINSFSKKVNISFPENETENIFSFIPDKSELKRLMRYVYENPEISAEKGLKARKAIIEKFNWNNSRKLIEKRLCKLKII